MKTKVQKWGNSLAVRIPKPFAEEIGLQAQTAVEISIQEGKLVVSRLPRSSIKLGDLLEGITAENLHGEFDTGGAVGNEAW